MFFSELAEITPAVYCCNSWKGGLERITEICFGSAKFEGLGDDLGTQLHTVSGKPESSFSQGWKQAR